MASGEADLESQLLGLVDEITATMKNGKQTDNLVMDFFLQSLRQGLPLPLYPQAPALRDHWPSQHLDPELP